jgi:hypothetical protein
MRPKLARKSEFYLESLRRLRELRMKDYRVSGQAFYDEVLGMICESLVKLKDLQPKMARFLQGCESKEWQKDFKEKFHMIFIDRHVCEEDLGYQQFNEPNKGDSIPYSNLCYGESFAFAFLAMLEQVIKYDGKVEDKGGLCLEMFCFFNAILLCNNPGDYKPFHNDGVTSTGSKTSPFKAKEIAAVQGKYGVSSLLYSGSFDGMVRTTFRSDYDHQGLFREFCLQYFEDKKKDKSFALATLVDNLASHVHLAKDANGRSAILLGWFLALTDDEPFLLPNLFNPYCVTEQEVRYGEVWSLSFFENPSAIQLCLDAEIEQHHSGEESRAQLSCIEDLVSNCFYDVVRVLFEQNLQMLWYPIEKQKGLSFLFRLSPSPDNEDKDYYLVDESFLKSFPILRKAAVFDLRLLEEAYEGLKDRISDEEDTEKMQQMLIQEYFAKVKDREKLSAYDKSLLHLFLAYYEALEEDHELRKKCQVDVDKIIQQHGSFSLRDYSNIFVINTDRFLRPSVKMEKRSDVANSTNSVSSDSSDKEDAIEI